MPCKPAHSACVHLSHRYHSQQQHKSASALSTAVWFSFNHSYDTNQNQDHAQMRVMDELLLGWQERAALVCCRARIVAHGAHGNLARVCIRRSVHLLVDCDRWSIAADVNIAVNEMHDG